MTWFTTKVEVTLIDDASGQALGVTKMPPGDLPESFDADTTLHLGDQDWSVVDAQPRRRADYAASKALTLRLRRVETIDPNQILFSLPSICDEIPPVGEQPLQGDELLLADDDWRQLELVSQRFARQADKEIAAIREIHETAAAEVGWRRIHVRKTPQVPIAGHLTLPRLVAALDVTTGMRGVAYPGTNTRIALGYALTTDDGLTLYGVAEGDRVQVMAIAQDAAPGRDSIHRLQALAQGHALDLVHWCRCARVAPNDEAFTSLLRGDAD